MTAPDSTMHETSEAPGPMNTPEPTVRDAGKPDSREATVLRLARSPTLLPGQDRKGVQGRDSRSARGSLDLVVRVVGERGRVTVSVVGGGRVGDWSGRRRCRH